MGGGYRQRGSGRQTRGDGYSSGGCDCFHSTIIARTVAVEIGEGEVLCFFLYRRLSDLVLGEGSWEGLDKGGGPTEETISVFGFFPVSITLFRLEA